MSQESLASQFVVGIGAAEGGIEALQQLLQQMPNDSGLTFLICVPLASNQAEHQVHQLQAATAMPVVEAQGTLPLTPNTVCVIPPNRALTALDHQLRLASPAESQPAHASIDHFLRALADTQQEKAIAVLLSGTGSDGSLGLQQIKEVGGLTVVQEPTEAAFDELPRAAIASGQVDLILSSAAIPARVLAYAASQPALVASNKENSLLQKDQQLQAILTLLQAHTGQDFSSYKRTTLLRRLYHRQQIHQRPTLRDYLRLLRENAEERTALAQDLLISVTYFFREPAAFEELKQAVLPHLFAGRGPADILRLWVAGCATGEEAYSLAMLMVEYSDYHQPTPQFQIFATDINEAALARARAGFYPTAIEADVTPERLARFFTPEADGYRVNKTIRESIVFARHNLLEDPFFSQLHLVVCRNVLIYFERTVQNQIIERFSQALQRDGYLFLGSAETLGDTELFRIVSKRHHLFARQSFIMQSPSFLRKLASPSPPRAIAPRSTAPPVTSTEAIHRHLFELYGPPTLLVNADYTMVHLSATAGRYLYQPAGEPTSNLLQCIRPELRTELTTALYIALAKQTATQTSPMRLLLENEPRSVRIWVQPAREAALRGYALVIFIEQAAPSEPSTNPATTDSASAVTALQEELAHTKYTLGITIEGFETTKEEMQATNEELQSSNEELRSAAEALETSREELQSINEELLTVNQQHKNKVEELSQLASNLHNLLRATDIATIFLDRALHITWFTPAASTFFHLRQIDVGRPLAHFAHPLAYDQLIETATQVLQTLIPQQREVRHADGRWYLLRLLPYRSLEDQIKGVVITLIEITVIKQAEQAHQASEERYRLMVQNAQDYAIFTLDRNGQIATWNQGCERLTGYTDKAAIGQPGAIIFTPEDRAANAPEQEFQTATTKGEARDERWHLRENGSRFWGSGVMIALRDEDNQLRGFAKIMRDYTERKEMEDALRASQTELQNLNAQLVERIEASTVQTRQLAAELVLAEQKERERIAHLLHDDLQQLLYALQTNLTLLHQDVTASAPTELLTSFEESEAMITQIILLTRQLSVDLSPPVLQSEGLVEALRWLATYMQRLYHLAITVEGQVSPQLYGSEIRILLFQFVRELLFNVVKHAGVQQAQVMVNSEDEMVTIQVTDQGVGFDVARILAAPHANGYGLRSIEERLRLFEGQLVVQSVVQQGTQVTIRLPLPHPAGAEIS